MTDLLDKIFWYDDSPVHVKYRIDNQHWVYLHQNFTLIIKRNPCVLDASEYTPTGFVRHVFKSGTPVKLIEEYLMKRTDMKLIEIHTQLERITNILEPVYDGEV